jgi:hypothetical protein
MTTDPASSEPTSDGPSGTDAAPESAAPEPVAPESAAPEPVAPESAAPEPAAPEPAAPEPAAPTAPALSEDQLSGALFRRWNGGAFVLGVLVLVGAAFMTRGGAPGATGPQTTFDPLRFSSDARWDQGQAEIARYEARRVIYSRPQTYELVRIAVKERFDPAQGIKGEAPTSLDAIKTIAVHDTPTHRAYRYRQQLVVQMPRRDPRQVLASSMSSQEWCGSTFVRLVAGPDLSKGLQRTIHSYFDGEGDQKDQLPPGVVLADQVPFLVRAVHWQRTPKLELGLLPTLLSNHGLQSAPVSAVLERVGEEELTVPAGTFKCVHVRVLRATPTGEAVDHYWVAETEGRPLVKFQDATGEGQLASLAWKTYWEDSAPSKEGDK